MLPDGVGFRVWAPHAESVSAVGTFNNWDQDQLPLQPEPDGYWSGVSQSAKDGDEYGFWIRNGEFQATRIDPYAVEVTNSVGKGIIRTRTFEWPDSHYRLPPLPDLVIYELHIGTFGQGNADAVRTFDDAVKQLDHLEKLGINAIEIMPVAEFAGDRSWGYNPAHPFAVEQAYGGPDGLRRFVAACHARNIGVILDVVYNHYGPSDLDLWRFDGWYENEGGGIYFYNDERAETPWGATRPDYGRKEVRQYIRGNALYWIEQFHIDGLRLDATVYVRSIRGPQDPGSDLPEGWSLVQWISSELSEHYPGRILIAEDLQDNEWLTKRVEQGGAGFDSQWAAHFVHPVRAAMIANEDKDRNMSSLASAIAHSFNGMAHQRVIYSESHDEVANGKSRVPQEVNPNDPQGWFAKKRAAIAAGLVFTSPGIPMIFQGQEFLLGGWFEDSNPIDWNQCRDLRGVTLLYRDLIALRRNLPGHTQGLRGGGVEFLKIDDDRKVLAFRRWDQGGAGDDVLVLLHCANQPVEHVSITVPQPGTWKLRFNSDWEGYAAESTTNAAAEVLAEGAPPMLHVDLPAYSMLIYSQDRPS